MNNGSNTLLAVVIVVIIVIVGWLAYQRGFFTGKQQDATSGGLEIKLGGSSNDNTGAPQQ